MEEKQQSNFEPAGVLWQTKNSESKVIASGFLLKFLKILVMKNQRKQEGSKSPDWVILAVNQDSEKEEQEEIKKIQELQEKVKANLGKEEKTIHSL